MSVFPSQLSFPKSKIKVLLLEGVDPAAAKKFKDDGFTVEELNTSLSTSELIEKIKDVYILGIRSATDLNKDVLTNAHKLMAIGCYCIGTNQVNLDFARSQGICVFNSPFSNSRSVAELIIGQIIALSRKLGVANLEMHNKIWHKYTLNRHEIRGKVLGIIGYGNIGTQLSVLAEAMGMQIIFYDTAKKLALGNAREVLTLDELLSNSDFVSLHVPLAPDTKGMISKNQIYKMKKGACLLNASRGNVVVIDDVYDALLDGQLGGFYADVFPNEPKFEQGTFNCVLQDSQFLNVIMTPHIGGATHEAQRAIGSEVSSKLIDYINSGCTESSVNFPHIRANVTSGCHRIINIHRNIPGVMKDINDILSDFNISAQHLGTQKDIGYLICDVDREAGKEIRKRISELPSNIKTRILY